MRISDIKYTPYLNKYNMTFKSTSEQIRTKKLYHYLQEGIKSPFELLDVLQTKSEEERYIGSLPVNWVRSFPQNSIKEKTSEIMHIFSDFAKDITKTEQDYSDIQQQKYIEILKQKLETSLKVKCDIGYIGKGDYGRVFRIKALGEDLALKTFYSDVSATLKAFHGNPKEISTAVALNKTLKPNQCSKFYCAKISLLDEINGFLLTKYVEPNGKIYPKRDPLDYSRFLYKDAQKNDGKNYIAGKLVDYGDVRPKYENYTQQQMAKQLYPQVKKKDLKKIEQLNLKYGNSSDWRKVQQTIISYSQHLINQKEYFLDYVLPNLSAEDIALYRLLGANFSGVEEEIKNYLSTLTK